MSDGALLPNWRRFPRARVGCQVLYGDSMRRLESVTRDLSEGGCRIAGYYPLKRGLPVALELRHAAVPAPLVMQARVVRLYGGAENAVAVEFADAEAAHASAWVRAVIAADPATWRLHARIPASIPVRAELHRTALSRTGQRPLAESKFLDRLESNGGPLPLWQLRREWAEDWERRAQVLFTLVGDGLVEWKLPADAQDLRSGGVPFGSLAATERLREALAREFGPQPRELRDLEVASGGEAA